MSCVGEINNKPVGESGEATKETPKVANKYSYEPITEDWVSDDDEEQAESTQKVNKEDIPKTVESRVKHVKFVNMCLVIRSLGSLLNILRNLESNLGG